MNASEEGQKLKWMKDLNFLFMVHIAWLLKVWKDLCELWGSKIF